MKSSAIFLLLILALSGCTRQPQKAAEQPAVTPSELVTGRAALQKLYVAAHGWAPDAQPFRLESQPTKDAGGHHGKSAIWRASFASARQKSVKPYTWSGTDDPNAPARGISPGPEDSYSPTNSSTQPFDIAFLKIDSDQAIATAQKHGGDALLAKSSDVPVHFTVDWNHNTAQLIWHVIYGENRDEPKLAVDVNASTGDFIRVEK